MTVEIKKGRAKGFVHAPPSKSFSHRTLICAALAEGESEIKGILSSEDISATADCIKSLGADIEICGHTAYVKGRSPEVRQKTAIFPCRESGSTLRFFIPLSLIYCDQAVFIGSSRLFERGIGVYDSIFADNGVKCIKNPDSFTLSGSLKAGIYRVRGDISSQFITGLLFALPLLDGKSKLILTGSVESRPYIDITKNVLESFGVGINEDESCVFNINGNQRYVSQNTEIEGDWSNAAFLFALKELSGEVSVTGLNENSVQGDRKCHEMFEKLRHRNASIDISETPDLAPVLFAVAAAKHGGRFTGTRRLRLKECDRAMAMKDELAKFGINVNVGENDVTVEKGTLVTPNTVLDGHNDHRIVMALSVLGTAVGAKIIGAEAVSKSYPDFFEALGRLGIEVEVT